MLKNRQDGLVGLHGTALLVIVTTTFIASGTIVKLLGWIQFTSGVNWALYLCGMLAAMIWVNHSLGGAAERLGALTTAEAFRLTAQQVMRLMVVLFTIAFVTKDVDVSRAYLIGFIGLASGVLLLANLFVPGFLARLFFQDQRLRTVIVASDEEARLLQDWLAPRHYLGIDVVGYVATSAEKAHGTGCLGTTKDLPRLLAALSVDQVVCAQSEHPGEQGAEITQIVERARCRMRFFVNMRSLFGDNAGAAIEHNEHYAFGVSVMEPLDNPVNQLLKRALDVAIALPVVVLVLPPLMLVVWAVQTWQSPGPVFYGQLRSGLNRQRFFIHKFRTMHVEPGNAQARQATERDARVYPFGRFLRRSSLDEMPQFLNVLLGTMSVSGPRPHLLEHDEQFSKLVETYYKRHFVKPGITGLAQSKGFRGEVIESSHLTDRVRYDMIYVATWSLGLDLGILLRTARQIIFPPRSAY